MRGLRLHLRQVYGVPEAAYVERYARGSSIKFASIEVVPTIHGHLPDVSENEDELRASWDFMCT